MKFVEILFYPLLLLFAGAFALWIGVLNIFEELCFKNI